ncbi:hypothetical protein P3X46_034029 [Hevea brasiliensis]|uniref:PORR domain-containing protein n=1 Tax=Hevea brasiliensis TaxID=3981 RepID=A0ABQ9K917_HEVBR|nr:hypothetical protein P3X46_034029 [Hevea brasiliensis]
MGLQKKRSLILHVKSLIQSKSANVSSSETLRSLRKLLMMSVDCREPLEKIEFIENALGLPQDFKKSLIPNYPDFFCQLTHEGVPLSNPLKNKARISNDGNFLGSFSFKWCFSSGFRANRMEFPSPYLNARRFKAADPKARKRVVPVLHELLNLTMEKRLTSIHLDAFKSDYLLPSRLLLCLINHHGILYIANKGAETTVFLMEACDVSHLSDKCTLFLFRDKFATLSVRREINLCNSTTSLTFFISYYDLSIKKKSVIISYPTRSKYHGIFELIIMTKR